MNKYLSEFETNLIGVSFPLAVAVSGGADSLALLLLAHKVAQKKGEQIIALTVDHGLRPESKSEAHRVHQWACGREIEHIILEWAGNKPVSRLQEEAREARYQLLIDWCQRNYISTLLLGHHQQDQEETFWMRLAAGSGLDGLSGMKKRTTREGIHLLRPLLGFSKECLQTILKTENQPWIEDPSNGNPQFFRGRLRSHLEKEGLSSLRLHHIMEKLQEDRDFIEKSLHIALKTIVQLEEGGTLTIQRKFFEELHPALSKRLLSFLMRWFSGKMYPPRTSQLVALLEKIKTCVPFTMGGIYWVPSQTEILLLREVSALKQYLPLDKLHEKTFWDQRFWVDPKIKNYVPKNTILAPMKTLPFLKREITSLIPVYIWPTLPALWTKGKVVAIPHLCYNHLIYGKDLREFIYVKPLFPDSLRLTI